MGTSLDDLLDSVREIIQTSFSFAKMRNGVDSTQESINLHA